MNSDCCGGQNKNSVIMVMCLWFLEKHDSIAEIDHKFMVPGQNRME